MLIKQTRLTARLLCSSPLLAILASHSATAPAHATRTNTFHLASKLKQIQSPPAPSTLLPPDTTPKLPVPPQPTPQLNPPNSLEKVQINQFELVGSSVFSAAEIAAITADYIGRQLTFDELLTVRSRITQLYIDRGYVTTVALLPPQTLEDGIVKIQIIEGKLADITINGHQRLRDSYIRQRIRRSIKTPLHIPTLLQSLQLLRLDPRIANIAADLQAGVKPGTNRLVVDITEADTFTSQFSADNSRSPSVGSFRRKVQLTESNLLGIGDALSLGYTNTNGSNGVDLNYTLPINPRDGTLRLSYGGTRSSIIERPFSALDILARSRYYEVSLRQPLRCSPNQAFGIGLTFSRQESRTELGLDDIGPFALSPGADSQGRTRISALRFFQDYTQRNEQYVLALRSQFSIGLDWFNATVNRDAPDSRFFAWRGQGQWLKQVSRNTQLVLKGDIQLTSNNLVPLEQFGLGGQLTVRGYRQDALLTDAGALFSIQVRLPLWRAKRSDSVLQITPFIEVGTGWNTSGNSSNPDTLVGTGFGLLWRQENFSARFDWGIPLVQLDSEKRSLQENGLYFSINYAPF